MPAENARPPEADAAGLGGASCHRVDRHGGDRRLHAPRLGILDFHPIQYHVPLYQRLASRGQVRLEVLYLHDIGFGYRPIVDSEFGVPVAWNIDLLSGYDHSFLKRSGAWPGRLGVTARLVRWLRSHEVVVIHGHSDPWMLFAAAACRAMGVPFLLRGSSAPAGLSTGVRRYVRDAIAGAVVSASTGGLALGKLNRAFYEKYGASRIVFAPHSVDNERFARAPAIGRSELLTRWGLDDTAPVVMFCGKLYPPSGAAGPSGSSQFSRTGSDHHVHRRRRTSRPGAGVAVAR